MLAWHYTSRAQRCRYGDGREDRGVGTTLTVDCEPKPCEAGLHGSKRLLDALTNAPSSMLRRVRLGGDVASQMDKVAATERTILAEPDNYDEAEYAHRTFARLVAADRIQYWDAPDVFREWLATGDPSIRIAARDASWDAPNGAAWNAVRAAAWIAAKEAAKDAAWNATTHTPWNDLNDLAEDIIPAVLGWDMDEIDGGDE